ncbi:MAG: DUF4249 domain-containing protein [Candidatus Cyclobacteriaceae bacterium M3_2C_046]
MTRLKLFIWFCWIFCTASCTEDILVDIPVQPEKLVINNLFSPDSLWQVQVSRTRSIADTVAPDDVSGAEVYIFHNQEPLEKLVEQSPGVYQSVKYRPLPGELYQVKVKAGGLISVEAENQVPEQQFSLNMQELRPLEDVPDFLAQNQVLKIRIRQPASTDDFFNLSFQVWDPLSDTLIPVDTLTLNTDRLNIDEFVGRGITFSADDLHGPQQELEVLIAQQYLQPNLVLIGHLKTISVAYYQYEISVKRHISSLGNPFAPAVPVYSNVNNGFGIFAGYQLSLDSLFIN